MYFETLLSSRVFPSKPSEPVGYHTDSEQQAGCAAEFKQTWKYVQDNRSKTETADTAALSYNT